MNFGNMRMNNQLVVTGTGYDGWLRTGERLINESVRNGGWAELFENTSDFDSRAAMPLSNYNKAQAQAACAIVLENCKRHLASMDETTRSMAVGGFQDHIFPIIRAGFATHPALDLVSVQPLTRRIGQVYHLNYKIAQTKGAGYVAGQRVFDAYTGYAGGYHYTDEYVDRETIATSSGAALVAYTTAEVTPLTYGGDGGGGIRPGTVVITGTDKNGTDTVIIRDNENGNLIAEAQTTTVLSVGTINYATGQILMTFTAGNGFAAGAVYCSYEYDGEGSSYLPSLDVDIQASPVQARRRAIRYRYSTEASQDYSAEFGMDLDSTIAEGIMAHVQAEQARQIIAILWELAGPAFSLFDISYSTTFGFSRREYHADLQWPLTQAINQIYLETQFARANWMIVDVNMQNVLNSIGAPHFVQWQEAPVSKNMGIQFIGVWNNSIRVYVDPLMHQLPGASSTGNALLGYKGDRIEEAGFIWAPYRMMYMTPAITLDDMVTRKSMASRIGMKAVNPRMYRRFALTGG